MTVPHLGPRTRVLAAVAVLGAAGAAAAGLTPLSIPPHLLGNPLDTAGDPGEAVEPSLELASLDLDPMGLHAVRVDVALATEAHRSLGRAQVSVEAVDGNGGILAEASLGLVEVPAEGAWEGTFGLSGPHVVEELDRTRVTVEVDGAATTVP